MEMNKAEMYCNKMVAPRGNDIKGDYMVSKENEIEYLDRYYNIMNFLSEDQKGLYHIDIPLAIETQKEILKKAGFKNIQIIWSVEEKAIMVAMG